MFRVNQDETRNNGTRSGISQSTLGWITPMRIGREIEGVRLIV